jgi:arylsulfatase A
LWGYDPLLIEPGRTTLASMLRAAGYHTAGIGKWHLGLGKAAKTDYAKKLTPGPNDMGFDYFFGIPASLDMDPYVFFENDQPTEMPTKTIAASKHRRQGGEGFWRAGPIAPSFRHVDVMPVLTKKAVEYIDERARGKQPFFLYFALSAPHTPWLPTKEFSGKSKAGYYGDFVVQVDDAIGQVLDALDRNKLTENTLIIVTSDNGSHWLPADIVRFGHAANWIFRGQKADIWEGGHRVPFLARWPGHIEPAATSTETICHTDMLATFAEIAGQKLPKDAGEDSYSILPALLGKQRDGPIREATVHHSSQGVFAIRQGDWVLIEGLGSGGFSVPQKIEPVPNGPKGQLYNLAKDIGQERNVYLDNPEIVARLHDLLERYKKQGYSRK